MKVLVLTNWDNSKDEEGRKKAYEYREKHRKYWTERSKKYNVKDSGWSDGTGKTYHLREFESYESYANFMDDKEFQKTLIIFFHTVNNVEMKVLREAIPVPP